MSDAGGYITLVLTVALLAGLIFAPVSENWRYERRWRPILLYWAVTTAVVAVAVVLVALGYGLWVAGALGAAISVIVVGAVIGMLFTPTRARRHRQE